jgi:Kef-type K+ transport system membrane component KefB/nucleotide-binding universal stress UspA family protein
MSLPSLTSHQLLVLWVELGSLLFAARAFGHLARRAGQPAVVGELIAGLVLGPSVFGHIWRGGFRWFLPAGGSSEPLSTVATLSLLFLLVVIGAETDLRLIRRLGSAPAAVSAMSLAVPMAAGAGASLVLPAVLVGHRGGRGVFALLIGATIAVSSLPVIAKIVSDMGLVRRNVGQLAIAAGTANDAVGFLLLALASGIVGGGAAHIAVALFGLIGLTVVFLTAGQRIFDLLLRRARRHGPDVAASLAIAAIGSLAGAMAMQAVGVEGALGAFAAGIALGRSRFQQGQALNTLNVMTATIFSPLYFATAGLRVDVGALAKPAVGVSFVAVTAIAIVAKFAGGALGGVVSRLHPRESVALGTVLNGRGALQVIIGTAGLGMGVLDTASYTVVILMSLVTSIAVPPVLRRVVANWEGSPEEQERLGREEELGRNVVVRGQRLLLPSRGSPNSAAAAAVLDAAWPEESEVTVLSITGSGAGSGAGSGPEPEPDIRPVLRILEPRTVETQTAPSERVLEEIVAEARLGYGVVALGAADEPSHEHLLSPVLDDLLTESPIPLLVVRRARGRGPADAPTFRKVVIPVSGTASSRAGQEVGCNLVRALGGDAVLLHVVTRGDLPADVSPVSGTSDGAPSEPPSKKPGRLPEAAGAADIVLRGAWAMANDMGIEPETIVSHGPSAGDEIVKVVRETGADTVALGASVRQVEGHPFLGHTVEQVLAQTDATVVVVALPEAAARLGALVAEASGQA